MTNNTPDITIRTAGPVDATAIAAILHAAFIEYKALYTARAFAVTTPDADQIAGRMHEGPVWVAERNGEILGTVSAAPCGDALHVRGMAVHPLARGAQIGQLLLKKVIGFGSTQQYKRLFLSTTPFLADAIRLYSRMGFRPSGEGPHDLWGTPLLTMQKEIGFSDKSSNADRPRKPA